MANSFVYCSLDLFLLNSNNDVIEMSLDSQKGKQRNATQKC